ncbi:inositol monophosphatase [Candidatus Parcubacteria bacterium]|nr:inositol monophosphatase [Candidatus Parcubacteria bacterium]
MFRETTVAVQCALAAGALIKQRYKSSNDIRIKEDNSLVSEVDLLSHDHIVTALSSAFPSYCLLSEEQPDALHSGITSAPTWVIDPLDGTSNFLAAIPLFAISIALLVEDKTRLGVIFDPIHDELFVAEAGKGATLNQQPIRASQKAVARGAMLFAGRGYKDEHRRRHAQIISAMEQQTPYFRRLGTATIMLAYVAAGRADAVILTGNNPWDTVAGALLVEEAGGSISDYCGHAWTHQSEDLVATNGPLHHNLINITRSIEEGCNYKTV